MNNNTIAWLTGEKDYPVANESTDDYIWTMFYILMQDEEIGGVLREQGRLWDFMVCVSREMCKLETIEAKPLSITISAELWKEVAKANEKSLKAQADKLGRARLTPYTRQKKGLWLKGNASYVVLQGVSIEEKSVSIEFSEWFVKAIIDPKPEYFRDRRGGIIHCQAREVAKLKRDASLQSVMED